jgi:2-hydroxychromene-2-carboxylate isomerase
MNLSFDFYFSFRSPYSYLATPQIAEIARVYEVTVNLRPVLPIAVRIPGFFQSVNPLWPPYLMRDTQRIAEMNKIPYRWPRPDPIVQDRVTREVASDQPHIYRVTRLGQAAADAGKGLAYAVAVARIIWNGEVPGWNEGDHLAKCAEAVGLDPEALDARIATDAPRLDAEIAANQADQTAAGHWGVPLFVFAGEPFFGQDRIDALIWRMTQQGLRKRS